MPVDGATAAGEVERGGAPASRASAPDRAALPDAAHRARVAAPARSTRMSSSALHAVASRHVADVRVLPQLHKVLGIL